MIMFIHEEILLFYMHLLQTPQDFGHAKLYQFGLPKSELVQYPLLARPSQIPSAMLFLQAKYDYCKNNSKKYCIRKMLV